MRMIMSVAVVLALALAPAAINSARADDMDMKNMDMKNMDMKNMDMENMDMEKMPMKMASPADAPVIPAVAGYAEGEDIMFLHTEASDRKIAKLLSDMMGSPVLHVPSLALTPADMLANLYVFANGIRPDGPMGPLEFQPDVFDSPPGHAGYSPLRKIIFVRWADAATPRILKSAEDVTQAEADGRISLETSAIVVNMPMLTWPGGRR